MFGTWRFPGVPAPREHLGVHRALAAWYRSGSDIEAASETRLRPTLSSSQIQGHQCFHLGPGQRPFIVIDFVSPSGPNRAAILIRHAGGQGRCPLGSDIDRVQACLDHYLPDQLVHVKFGVADLSRALGFHSEHIASPFIVGRT